MESFKAAFYVALAAMLVLGMARTGARAPRAAAAAEPIAGDKRPANNTKPPAPPMNAAAKDLEKSYRGPLPEPTAEQIQLRDALRRDLEHLAGKIGERNLLKYRQ